MSGILITGANGYLGSYVCETLLRETGHDLLVFIRAKDRRQALEKLWKAWQLQMDLERFEASLDRVTFVYGDLHAPDLGLSEAQRSLLRDRADSILHIAASLNRKSAKACFNTNLRGTLSLIQLARWLDDRRGLERFGFVSTSAIAGKRQSETLSEDEALEWDRSDYDPYARTKKFCEHMLGELAADLPTTIYRPSIVMGDSRHPRTTQFDMIFATCMLADLPVLPASPDGRVDIVNADWVGKAIARIHTGPLPEHDVFHLSSGTASATIGELTGAIDAHRGSRTPFVPQLEWAWDKTYRLMNRAPRRSMVAGIGALWKVFWPYVVYDTVFLNERAVAAVGEAPTPFTEYGPALYDWVKSQKFQYPHEPLPEHVQ